jgi:predicted Zn-dependent protease
MKTLRLVLVLAALPLLAIGCAEVMNVLEQATGEETAEGKMIRGLNRLRKSFQDLDPAEEHYIGRAVAAQVLADPRYPLVQDAALHDYVNRVGNAVAMASDSVRQTFNGYTFAVLDAATPNAFACPGGTILITKGLVRAARNEDELAAVLAHEIAHVSLRHGLAAIQQQNLTEAFTYLGTGAAQASMSAQDKQKLGALFDSSVQDIVKSVFENGYSREAEQQADQTGKRILAQSGYDPGALAAVLQRLSKATGEGGLFSTHPGGAARVADAQPEAGAAADAAAVALRQERFAQHVKP